MRSLRFPGAIFIVVGSNNRDKSTLQANEKEGKSLQEVFALVTTLKFSITNPHLYPQFFHHSSNGFRFDEDVEMGREIGTCYMYRCAVVSGPFCSAPRPQGHKEKTDG